MVRRSGAPLKIAGRSLVVGVSVGIALHPKHGEDFDTLLTTADRAIYTAKRRGGGWAVLGPSADRRITRASA